jgi:hypothetical protein
VENNHRPWMLPRAAGPTTGGKSPRFTWPAVCSREISAGPSRPDRSRPRRPPSPHLLPHRMGEKVG